MANLQNQVHIKSIDTGFFYTYKELKILNEIKKLNYIKEHENKYVTNKRILFNNEEELKYLYKLKKRTMTLKPNDNLHDKYNNYINITNGINKIIKSRIKELQDISADQFKVSITRKITKELMPANTISIFEGSLTRTLGINTDETTDNLIVIRTYHYDILNNLIKNGFDYKGKHYILFTASSGMLKDKKVMFIEEEIFKIHEKTIYCGLTIDKINEKGVIVNKFLSYLALTTTASEKWLDFDINKCIIVNDFNNILPNTEVNFIDYENYDDNGLWKITKENKDITIPVMDGAGICLNYTGIVRMPFVKGLMVEFDFKTFIKEKRAEEKENAWKQGKKVYRTKIGKVKDIWNRDFDILKDNIEYIFTKSQFKMWKYYDSWNDYKTKFIENGCEASKCMEESKEFKKAKFSYQALQTLYDLTDEELREILKDTNDTINNMGEDRQSILNALNATEKNDKKNSWQKALMIYPELLNDKYTKKVLRETNLSIVDNAKQGKFKVDGTYTFILPDVYAFCEWLFLPHTKKNPNIPKGLLNKGEVSCNHFIDEQEVSLTRSPHLNFSHCINTNVINDKTSKWYKAKGVYTSIFSTNSLTMAYDVDGDETLIISEPTIVKVAKRIMERHNFIPLYYDMKNGEPTEINNETLFDSMTSAFGKSVGATTNNLTKIWNSGKIGEDEFKAMDFLTMWCNFIIDYTKSEFLPDKSSEMTKFLTQYTNTKLPHFFRYIKDKNKKAYKLNVSQREKVLDKKYAKTNDRVVNRLEKLVANPSITFKAKNCGEFNYKILLHNKNINTSSKQAKEIIEKFKYLTGNKKFYSKEDVKEKHKFAKTFIKNETLKINSDENYVTDVLVKYYYHDIKSNNKRSLWDSFGNIILGNIKENIPTNSIQCENCGKRVVKTSNRMKYCTECAEEINREKTKNNKLKIAV